MGREGAASRRHDALGALCMWRWPVLRALFRMASQRVSAATRSGNDGFFSSRQVTVRQVGETSLSRSKPLCDRDVLTSIDSQPLLSRIAQRSQFHNDFSQLILLVLIQFGPFFGGPDIHTLAVEILQLGISDALHLEIFDVPSGIVACQQTFDLIG